jgi:hypothetical protein
MHVVWQDNPSRHTKRTLGPGLPHNRTQQINMFRQMARRPIRKADGKEHRRTGDLRASITRHPNTLAQRGLI